MYDRTHMTHLTAQVHPNSQVTDITLNDRGSGMTIYQCP